MPYDDVIEKHAARTGIPAEWLKKIARIESGGDPGSRTGSYKGLFQLSQKEFARHGGSGDIYDPEQNTAAAANKLAQESRDFKAEHGRDPKLSDLYMVHQQGAAGYSAHMANPDAPAWENVRKYYGSDKVAKAAIWGNLPDSVKAKYGSVEKVSSADFTGEWSSKVEGTAGWMPTGVKPTRVAEGESTPAAEAYGEAKKPRTFLGEDEAPPPAPGIPHFADLTPKFSLGKMRVPG